MTAAAAVATINADMHVDAHQHKVGPETTASVYHDAFFQAQHVVVNALVRNKHQNEIGVIVACRTMSQRGCSSTTAACRTSGRCWRAARWDRKARSRIVGGWC